MNETEKKLYDYAVSVDWDYRKMVTVICNGNWFSLEEHSKLEGNFSEDKIYIFIEKHKPQQVESITLPIEYYNILRKLEIKQEIKRLKREMKRL